MYSKRDIENFFTAVNSLKKYRRADLLDDKGNTIIEELYVDLLPKDQVFRSCLSDNTTFLVGRKGTGKSTIILRLEKEYRRKKEYISCYLDTKTIFEGAKTEQLPVDHLQGKIPQKALEIYLTERSFIQNVLTEIISELDKQFESTVDKIKSFLGLDKTKNVQLRLQELKKSISSNKHLKNIELPVLQEISQKIKSSTEGAVENLSGANSDISIKASPSSASASVGYKENIGTKRFNKDNDEWENSFSQIFLRVFQIKNTISEIKEILEITNIRHLVVFLDDFSEIEESALKVFVDVVLAPLNNWSDEFIKFKIAAYPNRIHFGGIDRGKVDIIDLDFYNLYSDFDRATMEERAIDFTKRLIESRISYFSNCGVEYFFDTKSENIDVYLRLIFQISMNVPRIVGYILFYCYNSSILYGKPITKKSLESASKKYYQKVIESFFDTTTYSLISYDEKISSLQQREMLGEIVNSLKSIRKNIITGKLKSQVYQSDKNNPFTSHFNFTPNYEQFLKTLELNFFISKYGEMSDRDGSKVSIYSINYGLAILQNLRWGKPNGSKYRKYFIARPFDFNSLIENFLKKSKKIQCINPECGKVYPYEKLEFLKFTKMKCVECQHPVTIQSVSDTIKEELSKIDNTKLLPKINFSILYELHKLEEPVYAKEIAEELDVSSNLVAARARKMDREQGLINRERVGLLVYSITKEAKRMYFKEHIN